MELRLMTFSILGDREKVNKISHNMTGNPEPTPLCIVLRILLTKHRCFWHFCLCPYMSFLTFDPIFITLVGFSSSWENKKYLEEINSIWSIKFYQYLWNCSMFNLIPQVSALWLSELYPDLWNGLGKVTKISSRHWGLLNSSGFPCWLVSPCLPGVQL